MPFGLESGPRIEGRMVLLLKSIQAFSVLETCLWGSEVLLVVG